MHSQVSDHFTGFLWEDSDNRKRLILPRNVYAGTMQMSRNHQAISIGKTSWDNMKTSDYLQISNILYGIPDIKGLENTSSQIRSSRPNVFCKKGVLRNFAKFPRQHLWQSLCFSLCFCQIVYLLPIAPLLFTLGHMFDYLLPLTGPWHITYGQWTGI